MKKMEKSFKETKKVFNRVKYLMDENKVKLYAAGGFIPYMIAGDDSERMHNDLDNICDYKDINTIRELFKKEGFYDEKLDSKAYSGDKKDYGFEARVKGVKVGVYPFAYSSDHKMIIQRTYDSEDRICKEKKVPCENINDYVMMYQGKDGRKFNSMSLEMIRFTKEKAGREKDIKDIKEIDKIGYRKDIYDRLKPYDEVKNIKAEDLIKKEIKTEPVKLQEDKVEAIKKEKEELKKLKEEVLKSNTKEEEKVEAPVVNKGFVTFLEIILTLSVLSGVIPTIINILINK